MSSRASGESEYRVRWYAPDDASQILSLHETVFGTAHSPEWFHWRYDTPYLDDYPVLVAEIDGSIVGVRTFLPMYVRANGQRTLAIQPAATMVHPDHRRQGIFTRLMDRTFEEYADEADLIFNFPTPAAKEANLKMGWRAVGRLSTWVRLQQPSQLDPPIPRPGTRMLDAVAGAYSDVTAALGDALTPAARDVEVVRHDGVRPSLLSSLYEQAVPERLHVHRDARFYRWRYANPEWDCTTYVARSGGDAVAAILTATSTTGVPRTAIVDSVPLPPADRDAPALAALLSAVVRDARSSAYIRAAASVAPGTLPARFGFVPDDVPPVSRVVTPTEMVCRPIEDDAADAWRFGGYAVDDLDSWVVARGDMDSAV